MKFATKPLQYKSFVGRVVVTPKVTPKMCFLRDISFFRLEKKMDVEIQVFIEMQQGMLWKSFLHRM